MRNTKSQSYVTCAGMAAIRVPWGPVWLPRTFSDAMSLRLQDKSLTRSTGRQVLADDGDCAVQDDKQQQYVSWDSLRRWDIAGVLGAGAARAEMSSHRQAVAVVTQWCTVQRVTPHLGDNIRRLCHLTGWQARPPVCCTAAAAHRSPHSTVVAG